VETKPPTQFTVPIQWALSGAVLSLPTGHTRTDGMGHAYYPADGTGDFTLPILNTGTESVSLTYGIQPTGAFSISPTPTPIIPASPSSNPTAPVLTAGSGNPSCSASPLMWTVGSAEFFYDGPVCQPLPPSVVVESCSGTLH
jgi:hypothetical protein